MSVDMHSLDRVNMARDRQRSCNIGPGVIGAYPRFPLGARCDRCMSTLRARFVCPRFVRFVPRFVFCVFWVL